MRLTKYIPIAATGEDGDDYNCGREKIAKMAKQRCFPVIDTCFKAEEGSAESNPTATKCLEECLALGETPLHFLLRFRPPVITVDTVCRWLNIHRRNYSPEDAIDRFGQTPLHVAVQNVCDISVIERLLNGTASYLCAKAPDNRQRYALHWACSNPNGIYKDGMKLGGWGLRKKHIENMTLVICKLTEAFPGAASAKDIDGFTPIDLAMKHITDRRIKSALLKAAFWTKQEQELKQQRSKGSTTINSHSDSSDCEQAARDEIPSVIDVVNEGPPDNNNNNPWGNNDDDYSSIGSRGVSRRGKPRTSSTTLVESSLIQI